MVLSHCMIRDFNKSMVSCCPINEAMHLVLHASTKTS